MEHFIYIYMYKSGRDKYRLSEKQELVQFWTGYIQRQEIETCAFWEDYFTIEIDGDDRLVSRDICSWWVAGAISKRAIGITT